MFRKYKNIITLAVIIIFITIVAIGVNYKNKEASLQHISYNNFLTLAQNEKIENVNISNDQRIYFTFKGDSTNKYFTDNPNADNLKEYLLRLDIEVIDSDSSTVSLVQTIFGLAIFSIAFIIGIKMLNKNSNNNNMSLNISQVEEKIVKFNDIAGNVEAKESVCDLIDFIKNPEKYAKYGARIPRGIILYGPPGTGKTLMAKAIAGEAEVPFFAVSGSDFVQMYVGVGAGRIRELFQKAREAKHAVIFIDEIDALGKKRSVNVAGGNEERDQTLNALLTEMSGFESNDGIIVIAATNRLDVIDEALLRPGRFDRQVEISLPDVSGREMILELHAKNKPLSNNVDLRKLAKQTVYFSGAMLENLLNEAAIIVAKSDKDTIELSDIDTAYYTIVAGSQKKDRSNIKYDDREITAFHEAGHAVVTKIISPENTISKVTIIPSTRGAGGFCVNIPKEKMFYTKREMENQIMISLAGRAAEELKFGVDNITTGASNDIEKATSIIKDYVAKYGMSKNIGLLNINVLLDGKNNLSIDKDFADECRNTISLLYSKTKNILKRNRHILELIAFNLLEKETLNEDELEMLVESNNAA